MEILGTDIFDAWLRGLRDRAARSKILRRIERIEDGNFGDAKFFGGIGELRINFGPGYQVYFVQRGAVLVILLCGGDKSSQARDIEKARALAKEL